MTPPNPAPVVPELPAERICANCACFARMGADGALVQTESDSTPICRRDPPQANQRAIDVPVLDALGRPVLDKRNSPQLRREMQLVIVFRPTAPQATCFDGWRPAATLPGSRWETQRMLGALTPIMEKALVQSGVNAKQAEQLGHALLTGLLPAGS
jgi:hypothetical protein